jgi:hypothetical protein
MVAPEKNSYNPYPQAIQWGGLKGIMHCLRHLPKKQGVTSPPLNQP